MTQDEFLEIQERYWASEHRDRVYRAAAQVDKKKNFTIVGGQLL